MHEGGLGSGPGWLRMLRRQCSTANDSMPEARNRTRNDKRGMACEVAAQPTPAILRSGRLRKPARHYNPSTDGANDAKRQRAERDVAAAVAAMAAWQVVVWVDPLSGTWDGVAQEPGPPEGGAPGRGGGGGKRKPQGKTRGSTKRPKTQRGKQIPRTGIG